MPLPSNGAEKSALIFLLKLLGCGILVIVGITVTLTLTILGLAHG